MPYPDPAPLTGDASEREFTSMIASFGLNEGCQLPRFPAALLIERNLRLSVWQLLEEGLLVEGAHHEVAFGGAGGTVGGPVRPATVEIRRETPHVLIDGFPILVSWHSPNPDSCHPYFQCPICSRRVRHIYLRSPMGCRLCHKLDWSCRHVARQTPSVARVARLRRRLGASDTRPFATLPPRRRGRKRSYYDNLVAQIHDEEAKLVAHLGSIVYDLNRRLRGRRGRRKSHDPNPPRPDPASS